MRGSVLVLVAAAACKSSSRTPAPAGPPPLARCDLETATLHTCTEIFDPARIAVHEKACANGTFTRNAACPKTATSRGCIVPDGSLTWITKGELACPRLSFTGTPFHYDAPQAYSCGQGDRCLEEHSVIDTGPTHPVSDCQWFRLAPCPTEHARGRCVIENPAMETSLVFSQDITGDQAVVVCATQYHGTFHSM
ncbi:MAG: hypothetical protein JO257_31005 [Deltaproteobacteria bacterium]|nr:hypothetical protein [Deltaproteobacteria bacterium]